jgi:hypothetical protein
MEPLLSESYKFNQNPFKSSIFRDIMLCCPVQVSRRFGGTEFLPRAGFLLRLLFDPEDRGDMFFRSVS